MSCPVNKGTHTFACNPAIRGERTVGKRGEFTVVQWHTCIACGERRGITTWGELIKKVDGNWKVIEP